MRPTAHESLYRDLEIKYGGYQDRILPANHAIRPLNTGDVKDVAALEKECFSAEEAASEEKIAYRIREAPELCCGIFVREYDWSNTDREDPAGVACAKSSLAKETLVAFITATKMDSKDDIDAAMELDSHKETGKFIAIHSIAVAPEHRGKGLAHIMLKDFVQRFFSLHTSDAIVILSREELVNFYEKIGFQNQGKSKSSHGSTAWVDMILPFDTYDDDQDGE